MAERFTLLRHRPQLVRNAPMVIVGIRADRANLERALPEGLRPHPDNLVLLNLWESPEAMENTGFGSSGGMDIGYLAIEVEGHDGRSTDGSARWPGRYFYQHWSGFPAARDYAKAVSGLDIDPGRTRLSCRDDLLLASLDLNGRQVVALKARASLDATGIGSGHSNYFARRLGEAGEEILQLSIPWVGDVLPIEDTEVRFDFPDGHPALEVLANGPAEIAKASFRRLTFVPYLGYQIL
ncbi:hypothetical protein A3711_15825 [Erythrobacter sp. HI00D59]|nr:hypothetical protein A3711_15825 [Erythrobacter sp. HI00D59]